MRVVLDAKDASDWSYRGEGAANLVLSYSGNSPDFIGKVLRIQKVPSDGSGNCHSSLTMQECLLWKDTVDLVSAPTREIAEQLYVQHIMKPFLGPEHVDAGIHVFVSRGFLEAVGNNILYERPSWRVDAAKVDPLCDSALLISDHSVFPHGVIEEDCCISIELKPKCGFLPSSEFIAGKNAIKRSITRFTMHQALKQSQGKISQISEYNPLDMFSGSKSRVEKAIKDLFTTPQNNFKVFLNGALVFGGLGGGAESTNCMLGEAFEAALKHVILAEDGMRTKYFIQLVAEAAFKSGLLDRLLEVQKLDNIDIEGAIHPFYDIVSRPCMVCREIQDSELSKRCATLHSVPLSESLKIVRDYLISATAKDLSLMISFKPRENGDPDSPYKVVFLKSTGQSFDYKASFIDLDMKPLKKMEYYYQLDQRIVSCYIQRVKAKGCRGNAKSIKGVSHSDAFDAMPDPSDSEDDAALTFQIETSGATSESACITYGERDKSEISSRTRKVIYQLLPCPSIQSCHEVFTPTAASTRTESQKTVVSVDLFCSRCRKKVMKLISAAEGINSIALDPAKSTVTVIGEADPVCIIKQVRKFRRTAQITSIGPAKEEKKDKEKDEKKDPVPTLTKTCQRCDVWYVITEDHFSRCNIL